MRPGREKTTGHANVDFRWDGSNIFSNLRVPFMMEILFGASNSQGRLAHRRTQNLAPLTTNNVDKASKLERNSGFSRFSNSVSGSTIATWSHSVSCRTSAMRLIAAAHEALRYAMSLPVATTISGMDSKR